MNPKISKGQLYNFTVTKMGRYEKITIFDNPRRDVEKIDEDEVKRRIKERKKSSVLTDRSITNAQSRAKNKIIEFGLAEQWDYFVTLTFDSKKVDRYDFDKVTTIMSNWLKWIKRNYANDLKYIIVPELHKDGAIHFHGLFGNVNDMSFIDSGRCTKSGMTIYNIGEYDLGFTTATKVRDSMASVFYMTKYITKEMVVITKNKKRYWRSYNLQKIEKYKGVVEPKLKEELETKYNFTTFEVNDKKVNISGKKALFCLQKDGEYTTL